MLSRKTLITNIIFIILTSFVTITNTVITPSIIFLLMFWFLGRLLPNMKQGGGESSFVLAGLSLWIIPLVILLTFPVSFFISMKLAIYLREKRGWEIKYPRRLFVVSLAIPIIIFILLSALTQNT